MLGVNAASTFQLIGGLAPGMAARGKGAIVNVVSPGPTRTPGTEPMGGQLDQLAGTIPLARPASAEEIAAAIVYLASDDASFITGAIVPVDGGRTAI